MKEKKISLSSQMKALKKTDLSPFIRMGSLMTPRLIQGFLPKLNEKQRRAFDKVMPVGGDKKIYIHLVGTPTPPIVIQMAQPLKMSVQSEAEVKKLSIKGVKMTVEDLQLAKEKKYGKLIWRLLGQAGSLLSLSGLAIPFLVLGPAEINSLKNKAMTHFKPLMDLMPH